MNQVRIREQIIKDQKVIDEEEFKLAEMKEMKLVREEMQEDQFVIEAPVSPNTGWKKRKLSKTSSKIENERWLNEVLDKRRDRNKLYKHLALSTTRFDKNDSNVNFDTHTGHGARG